MTAEIIAALPLAGWLAVFCLIGLIGLFLFGLYSLLVRKEVKLGKVEILSPEKRLLCEAGANNLLENQCTNANNLLSKIWIDIYDTGKKLFAITETTELYLLEDIAKLIDAKLRYSVYCDLVRNHIREKSERDLALYAEAKAKGYMRMVSVLLREYNGRLPKYHLPEILANIPQEEFKRVFEEIYSSSCNIAGKSEGGRKNV